MPQSVYKWCNVNNAGRTNRVLDLVGLVTSGVLGRLSTGTEGCVGVLGNA